MKNKFLPLLFVLGSFAVSAQVGIGTPLPNAAAQLDVVVTATGPGTGKGILIPRIALTSTTDNTTIKVSTSPGTEDSMLVFNTASVSDITPGYYYWFNNKWNRLASSAEVNGGVAGGKGDPGDPGISIPGGSTMYVNTENNTVYVLTPGTDPNDPKNWVPINGKDGNNGKDGMIGGKGDPGDPGVNIPSYATMYINTETGTVYVLKPDSDPNDPKNWVSINGKNGLDGKNGIAGGEGVPGEPGTPGIDSTVQMYVDYKTGIIYVRDPEDNTKWVSINGKNGLDGKNGIAGGEGVPGEPGTAGIDSTVQMYVDYKTGIIYVRDPEDNTKWVSINGKNGLDGKNGIAGGDGAPGAIGTPAIDSTVQMYIDYKTGIVYVRDPKDHTKWVQVSGVDGIPGVSGAPGTDGAITTLDAIVKDSDGNIYAYVGDSKIVSERSQEWKDKSPNWVKINGLNGADGIPGVSGVPGTDGAITTLDAIVKDPDGNIYAYVGDSKIVSERSQEWKDKSPNWVKINGLNGADGIPGVSGAPGTDGAITTLDAIVKDPDGNIYAYVGNSTTVSERSQQWKDKSPNWVMINGKNGIDGKNGIAGGDGAPGAIGTPAIDSTVQMYIDYKTGIVYVRDPKDHTKWVQVSGVDGIPGVSGAPGTDGAITTLDAIVKDSDGNIYAYVGDSKIVLERSQEWKDKSPNWVKINGLNGADGIPGVSGAPGTDGAITTLDAIVKDPDGNIYAYVGNSTTALERSQEWKDKSPNWVKINGLNGADGIPGVSGAPGTDGAITTLDAIVKDPDGNIYAYVGNSTTVSERSQQWKDKSPNWVMINGKNGIDGKNGIAGGEGAPGAAGTPTIDNTIEMYVDYKTGIVYVRDPKDRTKWVQVSGVDGIPGVSGVPGTDGAITTLDAIVKDPDGNIYAYVGDSKIVSERSQEWKDKSPNWVKINGLNGADGIPGVSGAPGTDGAITTLDAIVKDPDGNIYAYVGNSTTVSERSQQWKDKSPNWVMINGKNGIDGKNGIAGGEGAPGAAGTPAIDNTIEMYVDYKTGIVYVRDPKDRTKWVQVSGVDGIPGVSGVPGTDGAITTLDAIVKDPDGNIYAYVGNSTTALERSQEWKDKSPNWVKINGLNGADGIPGVSGAPGTDGAITTLDAIVKDPDGNIYAYVGNSTTALERSQEWKDKSPNWVKINGLNGADGIPGVSGAPGTDGAITTLDAIVRDPEGNIYAYVGNSTTVSERSQEWKDKSPNWVKINGLNGADGIPGVSGAPGTDGAITTLDAILKDPDGNIYAYVGNSTTVSERSQEWKDKSPNWIMISGKNGIDGKNGIAGGNVLPENANLDPTIQMYIDYSSGIVYVRDPKDATKWIPTNDETGKVSYDGGTKEFSYIDANGDKAVINLGNEPWNKEATTEGATSNTDDIYTKGWVGIGFDTKSGAVNEKLRVNGAITTTYSYYADYVFEDYFKGYSDIKADYKFKSLADVDAFIKANKHLPGITPINELEKTKTGYSFNVSQLSVQLLEKTEELYLHVIEQEKELETKNIEIQNLKAAAAAMNERLEKLEHLISNNK